MPFLQILSNNQNKQIMNTNSEIKTLKTLSELQVDRTEGFQKAAEDVKNIDLDLNVLFAKMANNSLAYKTDLDKLLSTYGEPAEKFENSFLSDIHKTWIDIKSAISDKDRDTVLSSCEFGENVIIGAYEAALEDEEIKNPNVRVTLNKHLSEIKDGLSTIKALRSIEEHSAK